MEGWVSPGPGCKEQLAHDCYATARSQRDSSPRPRGRWSNTLTTRLSRHPMIILVFHFPALRFSSSFSGPAYSRYSYFMVHHFLVLEIGALSLLYHNATVVTMSQYWRTKFYTEVRRGIWDHSFLLPICPADGHYALVAPIVWWCHLSDVQQSVTGRSRLLDPVSGTLCRSR